MPVDGHYDYCNCAMCAPMQALRQQERQRREVLSAMTFHERKAWRIAQRVKQEDADD